ncbi:hypothetical protein DITRI_Ditri05aG0100600 [Diplodiscus trichospermus]
MTSTFFPPLNTCTICCTLAYALESFSKSLVRTFEKICVFCGANYGKDESYVKAAHRLGGILGKRGINLIYGEGSLGLMGRVSTAAVVLGRRVLGIVPSAFTKKNLIGKTCEK